MTLFLSLRLPVLGLATALLVPCADTAQAADRPTLKGDVVVHRDSLTLGDLVSGVPGASAETPLFRAPPLGQTGTIQVRRILQSAEAAGLQVETGGRLQIVITRAARQVGAGEVESALKASLARDAGLDPRAMGIVFDGAAPRLVVPPETAGAVVVENVAFDRRTRRVSATAWIGASPTERIASQAVTGQVVELVEVSVLNRAVEQGAVVAPADLGLERKPRDLVPTDAFTDATPLAGRVARRALPAGSVLRNADLLRREIIAKGEIVSVVYEEPGIVLSMRARANDAGALGDMVSVVNPQSKKVLQAVVTGPGRVVVGPATPGRVAALPVTAALARP
jgi:flagella basal body P-ring formation protein FlgA